MNATENDSALQSIDWALSLRLAGNKPALARDMLTFIVDRLPDDIEKITSLARQQDIPGLIQHVHKLHGALCYAGFSKLKFLIATLEINLKNNIIDNTASLIYQINNELHLLLELMNYPHHAIAMAAPQHPLSGISDTNG